MCSTGCGGGRKADTWTVTYPDGRTETKTSAVAARVAAGQVEGATYAKDPK